MADLKVSFAKEKNESQQQLDQYKYKINELKRYQVDIDPSNVKCLEGTVQDFRDKISTMEKDHLEKIRQFREDQYNKLNSIEHEKSEVFLVNCLTQARANDVGRKSKNKRFGEW